jgi:hypothetical protein
VALALTGVAPDAARWNREWSKVQLASAAGDAPAIAWPAPVPQGVREAIPATDPVTLDLEDVPLIALLRHLLAGLPPRNRQRNPGFENWPASYQVPAAVERLDFVIHAGVQDFANTLEGPRVTVHAAAMPWNELFENLLASHGLALARERSLVFIAKPEDLAAFAHTRGHTYGGSRVTLDFLAGALPDITRLFHDITGFHLVLDPDARGYATLRLDEHPALYVLDVILSANDLAAARTEPPAGAPAGTTALRFCRRDAPGCDAVELWTLAAPDTLRSKR